MHVIHILTMTTKLTQIFQAASKHKQVFITSITRLFAITVFALPLLTFCLRVVGYTVTISL